MTSAGTTNLAQPTTSLVGDVGSGVDVREERFKGVAEGDVRDEVEEAGEAAQQHPAPANLRDHRRDAEGGPTLDQPDCQQDDRGENAQHQQADRDVLGRVVEE